MVKGKVIFKKIIHDPKLIILKLKYQDLLLKIFKEYKNVEFHNYSQFMILIEELFKKYFENRYFNSEIKSYIINNIKPLFNESSSS